MKPSPEQYERIYQAWHQCLPPLYVASQLRLVPLTIIREYLRLDEAANASYDSFTGAPTCHSDKAHHVSHV